MGGPLVHALLELDSSGWGPLAFGPPREVIEARTLADVVPAIRAAEAAARAARRAALGRSAEVLVEERRDGLWKGYSSQYIRYYLDGAASPGTLVRAVAREEHEDGVKGRIA